MQRKAGASLAHQFATGFSVCRPKHRHEKTPTRHSFTFLRFNGSQIADMSEMDKAELSLRFNPQRRHPADEGRRVL